MARPSCHARLRPQTLDAAPAPRVPPSRPAPRRLSWLQRLLPAAVGLLVLAPPFAIPVHAAFPGVRIAEILADPATGHPEFIELWNTGNATVDLSGWKVQDR